MEGQARRCHHTQATVISPLKLVPSILQNSVKVHRNKNGCKSVPTNQSQLNDVEHSVFG